MKPTQATARPGPEPLGRQHHPDDARRRHPRRLHRRALGHRADVEPDDLRQGDRRRLGLRRPDRRARAKRDSRTRTLFFELALTDLRRAAALFKRVHERTDGVDGRVSLEVSPKLADDAAATIQQAAELYGRAEENFFIKIPGTEAGRRAIEETIFAGIPVNVTLLFSTEQYLGAADAYMRGARAPGRGRAQPGRALRSPRCSSAAGTARSRRRSPTNCATSSGIAVGRQHLCGLPRSCSTPTAACGCATRAPGRSGCSGPAPGPRTRTPPTSSTSRASRPRSRSTRCPRRRSTRSPTTARSATRCRWTAAMPSETLKAFNDAGIDTDALADQLQEDGARAFVDSWNDARHDRLDQQRRVR